MSELDDLDKSLLNDFQKDFPLESRPYLSLANRLGTSEEIVIERLKVLQEQGLVSRVGAVFTPGRIGASVLAAMKVPRQEVAQVAREINSFQGVNHNYEREHDFNLWFVMTAPDAEALAASLQEMREKTGYHIMELPLLEPYHLDLGFDLKWS